MKTKAPFQSYKYNVEVLSPIHIGAAKENDYALGQDYFYNQGYYCFVHKRSLFRNFNNLQVVQYSEALAANNVNMAEKILRDAAQSNPELIYHKSHCPFAKQQYIKKHIADGMGNLIIPGSSLKGAISGVIGKYLMDQNNLKDFNNKIIFGDIKDNLMRYLQVGDISFIDKGEVTAFKIYSGDVKGDYYPGFEGIGQWKDERIGGHSQDFCNDKFVTHAETLIEGQTSQLRLNWADQLLTIIPDSMKHSNAYLFDRFKGNLWLDILKIHTRLYLEQEIAFFEKFPNVDFYDALDILKNLLDENNKENSALIRLGMGSGYHAITGNWKYKDHINLPPANGRNQQVVNAIKYKTRKIAFYDVDKETCLHFPGYLKLSVHPN